MHTSSTSSMSWWHFDDYPTPPRDEMSSCFGVYTLKSQITIELVGCSSEMTKKDIKFWFICVFIFGIDKIRCAQKCLMGTQKKFWWLFGPPSWCTHLTFQSSMGETWKTKGNHKKWKISPWPIHFHPYPWSQEGVGGKTSNKIAFYASKWQK